MEAGRERRQCSMESPIIFLVRIRSSPWRKVIGEDNLKVQRRTPMQSDDIIPSPLQGLSSKSFGQPFSASASTSGRASRRRAHQTPHGAGSEAKSPFRQTANRRTWGSGSSPPPQPVAPDSACMFHWHLGFHGIYPYPIAVRRKYFRS
jgi:hypothetical protein